MALSITVHASGIHGRGAFAAKDFQPGEIILDCKECAVVLTERELEQLSPEQLRRVSIIDGQPVLFKPPACWVNHSCAANARGANRRDVALRLIQQGEEITVDYVVEKVPGLNFQCNCGAPECRGFLTAS